MLSIKNLTKTFYQGPAEKTVLSGISFVVKRGQVFGFLGLNGEGKTTTVKIIGSLLFADKGAVKIGQFDHTSADAKQLMGFMPETPQFHTHLTATEVLRYAGELFGLEKPVLDQRIPALLEDVGLSEAADRRVKTFSKGMAQRLGFAAALINEPPLLVLDEPLDGLDPLGRLDFKKLISRLKKQGTTVFFSTHILSDVEEICDEVAILHNGKIIAQGSPKKLTSAKKTLEETFVELVKR
ncbi:MAG TPA: ABC transporter ATP-binding protein [Candidatus Saccharimonadales bacterium]|nr:ABC transporter ATP-binding protein [Candidatus Saccharimonadales bacterium]